MDQLTDRYEVFECLGKGGFGSVWRAFDHELQREVAIKTLQVTAAGRSSRESLKARFRREAIATAKIVHPNVVTIFDVGNVPGEDEIYVVMELLQGRTLAHEFAIAGAMDPARAVARFVDALDGLGEAHSMGIVHKDLKPANLFLQHANTPRERLKIIDFGIARMDSLESLTRTGRMVGSPRFLAPEYIVGQEVTPTVDVYQMGLILAEALTGQPCIPPGTEYMTCCKRHVEGRLDFTEALISSPFGTLVRTATSVVPGDRYPDGHAFATALREVDFDDTTLGDLQRGAEPTPRLQVIKPQLDEVGRDDEIGSKTDAQVRSTPTPSSEMKRTRPSIPSNIDAPAPAPISEPPVAEETSSALPAGFIAIAAILVTLVIIAAIGAFLLAEDQQEESAEVGAPSPQQEVAPPPERIAPPNRRAGEADPGVETNELAVPAPRPDAGLTDETPPSDRSDREEEPSVVADVQQPAAGSPAQPEERGQRDAPDAAKPPMTDETPSSEEPPADEKSSVGTDRRKPKRWGRPTNDDEPKKQWQIMD